MLFSRVTWGILFSFAVFHCCYYCYETIEHYLHYHTKTVIYPTYDDLRFPDVTVCNHNGFDMAVLKSLNDYLQMEVLHNGSVQIQKQYASERFEKEILKVYQKYSIFLTKYAKMSSYDSNNTSEIKDLKELFTRQSLTEFMSGEAIMAGGIPDWQLLLWCRYGQLWFHSPFSQTHKVGKLCIIVHGPGGWVRFRSKVQGVTSQRCTTAPPQVK